jgi:hypothetical protein
VEELKSIIGYIKVILYLATTSSKLNPYPSKEIPNILH